ncbi:bifunctional ADP-dependent NAD(P)H-hydrate dehydratase/NAD(P)H-hydrate epimerase [Legionella worsleiensis]|uniref:Bifunctional NAD(P)H-hydrate repair enzyme n=1 Tax=Legionella worsleiensis TaxID=45076 RepID=A0A0W1AF80_9GAMM|nr:bifunctional ADP-dependent NAD(P)H-hydrate dehydratase/NAD(P)H-hydrate epimerase [Legionella worsleiensis]KTD79986.1 sugar kinase [Legionella worsleiensis]STY32458.1 sugar kinase [Legionella worsleiensis]
MTKPENALYRSEHIRACEQQATQLFQLDEHELMMQAGTEALTFVHQHFSHVRHIAVFCGSGNNAGDGYVFARLAHEQGLSVVVYQCKAIADLPAAAKNAANKAIDAGVECLSADEPLDGDVELIVDALLGTGLKGAVHGVIATAINQINSSGLPVLSLDIPSGLNADTGLVENFCVKATVTLTFIALKTGMYTLDGPDYCGVIHRASLTLESLIEKQSPFATLLSESLLSMPLKPRKRNSHKGDYGHVLVVGGGPGMPGAASLAAKAALRIGAGAVSIATWPNFANAAVSIAPEVMIWGVESAHELTPLLDKATVCVIGPGLGESVWAHDLFFAAITSQLPMVIDASALRLLSEHPQVDDNWILTPHPGEAAGLLSCSTREIQKDRYQSARIIQQHYGGIVVLKGAGTIIQSAYGQSFVCPKGNPGMATAGMGDVLSGIIAGFCAQRLSLVDAAKLGVWIHAAAGDLCAQTLGEAGLVASDLLDVLPNILNCMKS